MAGELIRLDTKHIFVDQMIMSVDRVLQCYIRNIELLAGSGFLASGHDRRGVQVGPATNQCIDREGRLETYTFHLICRECTITLEDVQLQLGLPVDGYAATGFAQSTNWRAVYYKLLGVIPDNINGGRIESSRRIKLGVYCVSNIVPGDMWGDVTE
ncbi:hypothetical protein PVK06_049260 [Gossypium arboreum]|uniref:Aminotransferase-like plant mobile domain-containing protein n=1 Tax=Gossypium arboreum TaxID=29729 RepID=A0ABR0MIG7_GOSAR|nr:hypothetical protein PVK06_049260 [Gossypium arboreum]